MNAARNSAVPTSGKSVKSIKRPTMQGVSSVQSGNVLSSARIHAGLGKCETTGRITKETHDLLLHEVGSQCVLKMGEATIRISDL